MLNLELTQENINDIKESLAIITTLPPDSAKNVLIEIRKLYPVDLLKESYLLLTNDQKRTIKSLTIQINNEAGVVP